MNRYKHVRDKAVELRRKGYSLTAIQERLQLNKTTIYYWIKDIKTQLLVRSTKKCHIAAGEASRKKFEKKRKEAYDEFKNMSESLLSDRYLRDFILLYMTEGYRRNRNSVSISNSNPNIVVVSHYWLKKLSNRPIDYGVQIHIDNDESEIKGFWSRLLNIDPGLIRITRKSNSGGLSGRVWRSVHGVFQVRTSDTYFRSKIEALMDAVQEDWKRGVNREVAQLGQSTAPGTQGFAGSNPVFPTKYDGV